MTDFFCYNQKCSRHLVIGLENPDEWRDLRFWVNGEWQNVHRYECCITLTDGTLYTLWLCEACYTAYQIMRGAVKPEPYYPSWKG